MDNNKQITIFQDNVRRTFHDGEWWFSIIDVVEVLSESKRPRKYWSDLKSRLSSEGFEQLSAKIGQLKMTATDGKKRVTDVANRATILRIIQSIPSPKAEPFKQWLAKVGNERLEEEQDPNLILERLKERYYSLGYTKEWIDRRIQSVIIRGQLTEEWKNRGVLTHKEYAILTAEISKGTFGVTPSEHKGIKGLKREPLRDHMTNEELIFTMLGEDATRNEAIRGDYQGFNENVRAAQKGGYAAGKALQAYQEQTGKEVVSEQNFKQQIKETKKKQRSLMQRTKKDE
jgi:hypothetical protein